MGAAMRQAVGDRPLVVIDHRWGSSPVLMSIFISEMESLGYRVDVRQLETGDIVWGSPLGRVGVEVKRPDDLLRSHQKGRLDEQLAALSRYAAVPVLLIWGRLGDSLDLPSIGRFTWAAVDNLLLGRQMSGVLVAHTGDLTLAQRVDSLRRYLDRHQGPRLPAFRRRPLVPYMGKVSDRVAVLYHLLGAVGGVKNRLAVAERLAHQGSLREILSWSVEDWQAAGFTRHMARKIHEFVNATL